MEALDLTGAHTRIATELESVRTLQLQQTPLQSQKDRLAQATLLTEKKVMHEG